MTAQAKLTKTFVDRIPYSATGQQLYFYDSDLAGFGLRVGTTSKAYFAEWKIRGKTARKTIGRHGPFNPESARKEALGLLAKMQRGINPIDEERKDKARGVTLDEAFKAFMDARKSLKPNTIRDYEYCKEHYFAKWKDLPLTSITRDKVSRRHAELGETSPARANLAMRFLRALFNFAITKYEPHIMDNPVKHLSATRSWYKVERRQRYIKREQLKPWFDAVIGMRKERDPSNRGNQEVVADYLILVLLTGLRRDEAAKLQWSDVNLVGKTLTVRDTKNHKDHTLPLSDFLLKLLRNRKIESGLYVFPGFNDKMPLIEPRRLILELCTKSGVEFRVHDLRRTFATIADSLDIPGYALKRLLNHSGGNDVTSGYIIADIERLRKPMQRITDFMLKCAGIKTSAKLIAFQSPKAQAK